MPQNDGNITVKALSDVALPSPGEFTLFFDTQNSDKLTSVGNIAGIRVVRVYDFSGGLYKGLLDASTNPLYPPAVQGGEYYIISVGGKVGGASGAVVNAGDLLIANAPNPGGTQAAVGTFWDIYANAFDLPIATKAQSYIGTNNASISTPLQVRYAIQGGGFMTSAALGTNAYTSSMSGTLADYTAGSIYELYINNENTGASTLNIDGLGALSIVKADPNSSGTYRPLVAGDIKIGYNRFVYDTIANAFVLISRAGQNIFSKGKTIYVDSIYGNNLTAQKYNPYAPYATPAAAHAAAVSGDTIEVITGAYTSTTALGKDGVNWFFNIGVALTNNTTNIFDDLANPMTFNVAGFGNFVSSGFSICKITGGGTINFLYSNATTGGIAFINTSSTLFEQGVILNANVAYQQRGSSVIVSNTHEYLIGQFYDLSTTGGGQQLAFSCRGAIVYIGGAGVVFSSGSAAGDGSDLTIIIEGFINIATLSSLAKVFDGYATVNAQILNQTTKPLFGDPASAVTCGLTFNNFISTNAQFAKTVLASVLNVDVNNDVIVYASGNPGQYACELSATTASKVNFNKLIQNKGTGASAGGLKKVDGAGSGDFTLQVLPTGRIVLSASGIGAGAKSELGAVTSVTFNNYAGSSANANIDATVTEDIASININANVK